MKIIAFEGIDASGKETQAHLLTAWLQGQGYNVYQESFPRYDTPVGRLIKDHLQGEINLNDEAFHMLLEVDRQDFMTTVRNMEQNGTDFMVLDRFTLSNLAFGKAKGLDPAWLTKLQEKVIQPDITFFVDISVETSFERRSGGRDKYESDNELLRKARFNYLETVFELKGQGTTIFGINGENSTTNIFEMIKVIVQYCNSDKH
ncbi:dTMP kinase [Solibacillus silvestris]